jgi:hypothetical protein
MLCGLPLMGISGVKMTIAREMARKQVRLKGIFILV